MGMNFRGTVLSLALLWLVACDVAQEQDSPEPVTATADWVLTGGQILTVDADFSVAEAIAIQNDRVMATGSNDEINALAGATTRRTDLEGRTLIPGLIDNHMHFVRATQQWYRHVRWDGVNSRALAFERIRARGGTAGR